MEITALNTLKEIAAGLLKRNVQVLLCDANPGVSGKQRNAGITQLPGEKARHTSLPSGLQYAVAKGI